MILKEVMVIKSSGSIELDAPTRGASRSRVAVRKLLPQLSSEPHRTRAHMTITGGAMLIIVFCKTYGIGRSKAYDLINTGAVAARQSSKATLIDRVSAEAY